ncbi:MAG: transaldolase [Candidatus Dormibacter sp.]
MNAAARLHEAGQSLWLDNITRNLLTSGQLARYITEDAVTGLTSNPSIFDKAITGSDAYDEQTRELAATGLAIEDLFFELALDDLTRAAALFKPVWDSTRGADGWVSLEVSPRLAHDTKRTVAEAEALHQKAGTPNLFIKVPGNREGLPAIEELTFQGVPVNVTLLFSNEQYLAAAAAYQRGLERREGAGLDLNVPSVASLFVSRWDRATLDKLPDNLKDELGIAVAKQTYRGYREVLASAQWKALEARGAHSQRLLFASTGTKDPAKPDTYYIQALAAPDTINTIPPATLEAFADHGEFGEFLPADGGDADEVIAKVEADGINVPELAASLQSDGAASFVSAWEDLLRSIESKAASVTAKALR